MKGSPRRGQESADYFGFTRCLEKWWMHMWAPANGSAFHGWQSQDFLFITPDPPAKRSGQERTWKQVSGDDKRRGRQEKIYPLVLNGIKNYTQRAQACSSCSHENKSTIYYFSFSVFKYLWHAIHNQVNCEWLMVYLQSLLSPVSSRTAMKGTVHQWQWLYGPLTALCVPYGTNQCSYSHGLCMVLLVTGVKEYQGNG